MARTKAGPGPWSQCLALSRYRDISGSGLGPGPCPSQNFCFRHTVQWSAGPDQEEEQGLASQLVFLFQTSVFCKLTET